MPYPVYTPRVAIVTGSARGIGYSVAQRLADDGFDVAVNDISGKEERLQEVAEEIRKKGRKSIAVPANVTNEQEVKDMIKKVVAELGRVDVMVANAGVAPAAPFLQTSVEQLDSVLAVNVRGVFLCFQHAALQMIKDNHGGRLIAASSAVGKEAAPYLSAYSATKFAVRGITQSAAKELKHYGITVNAYAPGIIRTELMMETAGANGHAADGDENPLRDIKKTFGFDPDCPDASPDVVGSVVSYLVKPESHFITGQAISVDGGVRFD